MTEHRHESILYKSNGDIRRVGFEIEFSGLTFQRCLDVLQEELGNDVFRDSQVEATIRHAELGDFDLELDWQFLKTHARENEPDSELIRLVADIASTVVPLELVCPPIPIDRIESLRNPIAALRKAGAKGTDDSFFYAFGVHINTELPDLEAATIIRYLQAYCVLQDYLVDAHAIDTSRKLSPYVDLYKEPYIRKVLDYRDENTDTLKRDYVRFNPTRNRALDMLPLFAHLDAVFIQNELDDPRIKGRPAFHYRMPNCHIERPSWSLETDWRIWCVVEKVANDTEALSFLIKEYQSRLRADQFATDSNWAMFVKQWIANHIHDQP